MKPSVNWLLAFIPVTTAGSPAITANFVEMRRVTSELADVEQALAVAEEAWLDLEDRAP